MPLFLSVNSTNNNTFLSKWLLLVSKKEKKSRPGVDVMIPIFCDFEQFSAKKILKKHCYDTIFA
jgi:hypothetical protein